MKIGDRVGLKSGSIDMTIVGVRKDGRVVCAWFDQRDNVHKSTFPEAALEVVRPLKSAHR